MCELGRAPAVIEYKIAAIDTTQQLTLVTHNHSDYQMFDGLTVVDWFE